LIGNKSDLENRKITYDQGKEFADTYGMKYIETSAKTAHNVADAYVTMTKDIIALNSEKDKAMKKGKLLN
jgi:ketosteroid isomerase-like protein